MSLSTGVHNLLPFTQPCAHWFFLIILASVERETWVSFEVRLFYLRFPDLLRSVICVATGLGDDYHHGDGVSFIG
jgi:hypothetical protein